MVSQKRVIAPNVSLLDSRWFYMGKLIFEIDTVVVKELECRRVQNYRYYSDMESERAWYIVLLLYEAKERHQPKLQISLIKMVFLNAP